MQVSYIKAYTIACTIYQAIQDLVQIKSDAEKFCLKNVTSAKLPRSP